MTEPTSDLSLFFKVVDTALSGAVVTDVDDTLSAGSSKFEEESKVTERTFESRSREYDNIKFSGVKSDTTNSGFLMHQSEYVDKLQPLQNDCDFTIFRPYRHLIALLTQMRPDLAAVAAFLSQVTKETFDGEHIKVTTREI